MTVTWSGWVKQPPGPGGRGCSVRRAAGETGGGDTLCPAPLPLGEASNFPTEPRASSSLAGLADTPSWPGRGCSAHGEDAGWHRLIVLGCGGASHHGDGRPRHLVFLPAAPENRRGASSAPKGFSPSFLGEVWGPRVACGLSTLTFSSSSSSKPRRRR